MITRVNKVDVKRFPTCPQVRSEEHTSELPSLMRKSYAVFCLKKKKKHKQKQHNKIIVQLVEKKILTYKVKSVKKSNTRSKKKYKTSHNITINTQTQQYSK